MRKLLSKSALIFMTVSALGAAGSASAHGDVVPQAVKTDGLPAIEGTAETNPYRGKDKKIVDKAVEIGSSAYNQNCARCHGLGAVSGGIAPDLRMLPVGDDGDEIFAQRIRNGSVRNGVTYMPPFGSVFSEPAIWAIRTYLDSVHVDE